MQRAILLVLARGMVKTAGLRVLAALALGGATAAPLAAQALTFDAYAGRATYDPVASAVGVRNAVVGLRYQGTGGEWVYLSVAAPLAAGDPSWAAAGLALGPRLRHQGWSLGVRLTGHGYLYQDSVLGSLGAGGTAGAAPFVAFRDRSLAVQLSSGPVYAVQAFQGVWYGRAVHRTDLSVSAGSTIRIAAEGRYLRADEGAYPYSGLSAHIDLGRGRVWGGGGRWFSAALEDGVEWRAGAALEVTPSLELWSQLRHEATDPIYWSSPRRSWNVGVSWRPGQARSEPVPVGAVAREPHVEIRLPLSAVQGQPRVAGDFNGWEPVPMERVGRYWVARLDVPSGVYRYAFVDAEGGWFVPEDVPGRRSDGMGGFVAVVAVP